MAEIQHTHTHNCNEPNDIHIYDCQFTKTTKFAKHVANHKAHVLTIE